MRHLERVQMSTDSALLTSQIILTDKVPFKNIPFIDSPEVQNQHDEFESVGLEGFRYITKQFDVNTGKVGEKKTEEFHMHPRIGEVLVFIDFDLKNMDPL